MSIDASKPWHPRPKEPAKAYDLFTKYLDLGPDRSYQALAGCTDVALKLRQIATYGRAWEWPERANAYDSDQMLEEMKGRVRTRERVRQTFYDEATAAARVVLDLMVGVMPLGDVEDILNKHQKVIGQRARVSPSTRLQAAQHVLAMAGLIVPKRVELDDADGDELRLQARQVLGTLDAETARSLLTALEAAAE